MCYVGSDAGEWVAASGSPLLHWWNQSRAAVPGGQDAVWKRVLGTPLGKSTTAGISVCSIRERGGAQHLPSTCSASSQLPLASSSLRCDL